MTAEAVAKVADLLDDRSHHIEFNGHLTNHVKHAVVALAAIGAPEHVIRDYYKGYAELTPYGFPLEPQRASTVVIDAGNWCEFIGQRAYFSAYVAFFDREVAAKGIGGVVAEYAPELLRGWIGAFTHAAIHLGWAVWAEHAGMTAEALAYLAFSFVRVTDDERTPPISAAYDPVESLVQLSENWTQDEIFRSTVESVIADTNSFTELHPELNRSGLQARVAGVAITGIPELIAAPAWIYQLSGPERRARVRRAVTLLYLAQPGDFVVLHLITSLFALETIADTLDSPTAEDTVYELFWAGLGIITAAERKIPTAHKLRELARLYSTDTSTDSLTGAAEFEFSARRAWLEDEEHNPKLVFVLRS
ncbi:questin oxidase family protein [Nocardia crassostreae]|uniref:questin oxidase family protein n=1 Tax=Nocardia crassostreae TaxID=53428 RepID=UPI000A02C184|nr:questin oxidase family protein [Nocardia crassostreae]